LCVTRKRKASQQGRGAFREAGVFEQGPEPLWHGQTVKVLRFNCPFPNAKMPELDPLEKEKSGCTLKNGEKKTSGEERGHSEERGGVGRGERFAC